MTVRTLLCHAALLLAAAACGGTSADERLGAAEHSVLAGDPDDARRGVELLLESADTASMTAAELCRAAMVYASLADENGGGNEADAAMAARCVSRALRRDAAAVDTFMQSLPVEERARLSMAIQLCAGHSMADIHDYEMPDTAIFNPDTTYHHRP